MSSHSCLFIPALPLESNGSRQHQGHCQRQAQLPPLGIHGENHLSLLFLTDPLFWCGSAENPREMTEVQAGMILESRTPQWEFPSLCPGQGTIPTSSLHATTREVKRIVSLSEH
jgi:hypothetical protein